MQDIKHPPKKYSQIQRKEIIKKLVEADCAIFGKQVAHGDLHPRNIMICENQSGKTGFRVAFVDFGVSRLMDVSNNPNYAPSLGGLPVSPILMWDYRVRDWCDFQLWGWIDWDWQSNGLVQQHTLQLHWS